MWVLFFEIGYIEFALVERRLVQVSFDVFWLAILFPVVKFELLLHNVVLGDVPHKVVSKFYTSHDSYCQAHISR